MVDIKLITESEVHSLRKSYIGILTIIFILLFTGQAMAATHVVSPGESLWLIAQEYGTTVEVLAEMNNLADINYIEAGQNLTVPDVHIVAPGETLWKISQKYGVTVQALATANKITNVNYIEAGAKLIIPKATSSAPAPVSRSGNRTVSQAELELLARLVHAEAGGEPYLGQVAVAATVLNRVESPLYPNSITAVIYQVTNGYYQYSPVLDGRINLPATESAYKAALEAINGADPTNGATGFYNPSKTTNQWVRSQPVATVIGNHVFFY